MVKLFLSTAIILFSFCAYSQFKIGPLFGYNYNMPKYVTSGDSLENQSISGNSFSGGFFASYELEEHFQVMTEILISGRYYNTILISENSEKDINYYEENFSSVGSINLEIPMLAVGKIDFRRGKYGLKKTLSAIAGPVFLMNLGDSYYRSSAYRLSVYNQESIEKEEVVESPFDYRLINLGFLVGAQYEFTFGLRVGARFQTNLMSENKNQNFDLHYSQFQLNLGYTIFK